MSAIQIEEEQCPLRAAICFTNLTLPIIPHPINESRMAVPSKEIMA